MTSSSDLEFVVFRDSLGEWRWRLMDAHRNAVLAFGATAFKTCEECVNAIYVVMGTHSAVIRDGCVPESVPDAQRRVRVNERAFRQR